MQAKSSLKVHLYFHGLQEIDLIQFFRLYLCLVLCIILILFFMGTVEVESKAEGWNKVPTVEEVMALN